uniref:OAR domain-containing protein n=1 Tax=Branchiostoma floridae TaxID=7739 RepID=C3ZI08_BRAFL|eukprot:XP_002591739.1 hypothetical protein BRAFLDRAFT_83511 [Branchiostoma floridae]
MSPLDLVIKTEFQASGPKLTRLQAIYDIEGNGIKLNVYGLNIRCGSRTVIDICVWRKKERFQQMAGIRQVALGADPYDISMGQRQNGYTQAQPTQWTTTTNASCMAPQSNPASFMGVATQAHSYLTSASPPTTNEDTYPSHMTTSAGQYFPGMPGGDSDRRTSSIAELRLKAKEHSVAMGLFGGVYVQ